MKQAILAISKHVADMTFLGKAAGHEIRRFDVIFNQEEPHVSLSVAVGPLPISARSISPRPFANLTDW
jgi:hypothetical protein